MFILFRQRKFVRPSRFAFGDFAERRSTRSRDEHEEVDLEPALPHTGEGFLHREERAEEERNGLIRWLRPEYQAPKEVTVQPVIEGITTEEDIAIAPVEQQTWSKKFKEQLAAIRDLLRTSNRECTLEQIVAQFKGATRSKKAITECLESLEELGIVASHVEEGVTRWYFAELQKAN